MWKSKYQAQTPKVKPKIKRKTFYKCIFNAHVTETAQVDPLVVCFHLEDFCKLVVLLFDLNFLCQWFAKKWSAYSIIWTNVTTLDYHCCCKHYWPWFLFICNCSKNASLLAIVTPNRFLECFGILILFSATYYSTKHRPLARISGLRLVGW